VKVVFFQVGNLFTGYRFYSIHGQWEDEDLNKSALDWLGNMTFQKETNN
jgi:hypothetical protein